MTGALRAVSIRAASPAASTPWMTLEHFWKKQSMVEMIFSLIFPKNEVIYEWRMLYWAGGLPIEESNHQAECYNEH